MKPNRQLATYVTPAEAEAARKLAEQEQRSVSYWLRSLIQREVANARPR